MIFQTHFQTIGGSNQKFSKKHPHKCVRRLCRLIEADRSNIRIIQRVFQNLTAFLFEYNLVVIRIDRLLPAAVFCTGIRIIVFI